MTVPAPLPEDVRHALEAGHKIEAIRLYRQHYRVDLKEAKDAVDAAGITASRDTAGLSPGEQSRSGRTPWLVAAVVIAGAAAHYFMRP